MRCRAKNSLGPAPTKHECNNIQQNYEANNINSYEKVVGGRDGKGRELRVGLTFMQFCIYEIYALRKISL